MKCFYTINYNIILIMRPTTMAWNRCLAA